MSRAWRARDHDLLDALDRHERVPVRATVWRVVRGERDPLLCHSSGGRWDPGHFDVLYTAFEPTGAKTEMYFHLSRQPVFPSRVEFVLAEVAVTTRRTLRLETADDLTALGVEMNRYADLLYRRTQEIADAAAFLGFDGIAAPSARRSGRNLTIFCDSLEPDDLVLQGISTIDRDEWRTGLAPTD